MTMKKTDLEKRKGKKIAGAGYSGGTDRYGKGSHRAEDKKGPDLSPATAGLLKGFLKKPG
jgi:hypothetical protein